MDADDTAAVAEALELLGRAKIILMHTGEDIAEIADVADQIEDMEFELRAIAGTTRRDR